MGSHQDGDDQHDSRRRIPGRFITLTCVVGLLGAVGYGSYDRWPGMLASITEPKSNIDSRYLTDSVSQGLFGITVRERGTLESMSNALIASEIEGSTTILSIVPEGTLVKHGELVCELDVSALREKEKEQRISITQAQADVTKSHENLEIQERKNESDIAAANLAMELAELDLKKYQEGEYLQQKREMQGNITLAEEELARAKEIYEFSRRLARKGYKSQNELEADRIALTKAEIALKSAQEKLRVLEQFDYHRMIRELEETATESKRELERVRRAATATYSQYEADYKSHQMKLELEESQLENYQRQIKAARILAPMDGEIVYDNKQSSRRGSEELIGEGTSVRERQVIAKIPDLANMKVDARIHESMISMVSINLPAEIRIDAFPELTLRGKVIKVAAVPQASSWMRPDVKEYEVVVEIDRNSVPADISLKPGLTAEIEILVEMRENVVQVPMQAVVAVGPERMVFVVEKDGKVEQHSVIVGKSSDTKIEILKGLEAGETIVLNPRTHFAEEIAEITSQVQQTLETERIEFNAKQESEGPAGPSAGTPAQGKPPGNPGEQRSGEKTPRGDFGSKGDFAPKGKGAPKGDFPKKND
ncbi:efflux RND transporter periplasmic adaptor subunit [Calycomorphotria hydatis]|uniref:Cation efflux system protein CusB n=1 Tax=Calycomorphotria hydatis TaxID=2528027 RepID=A0A517T563_9PLAN|nr:efflux RND transporter periplasmic adaptor subunit [Calycomorphotria hydatis]QDT63509.1 Cation efflux system protein CusB precursor [Calycomorphotria hydatis]